MHMEFRTIQFTADETLAALQSYAKQRPGFLPPGTISVEAITAREVIFAIDLTFSVHCNSAEYRLTAERLLEPLIAHCIENAIPLPRLGKKSIRFVPDGVVMEIRMETGSNAIDAVIAAGRQRIKPPTVVLNS